MPTQGSSTAKASSLKQISYRVPEAVRAFGEPEEIFAPATQASQFGKLIGGFLGIVAVMLFGIAAMLLYCGVHPFGSNPPPPTLCWILGGVLALLGGLMGFGAYHFLSGSGDNKQAYLIYAQCLVELLPNRHRIIPWEKLRPSKNALPPFKIFRFATGKDKEISFDGSLPRHEELAARIARHMGKHAPTVMEIKYSVGPARAAASAKAAVASRDSNPANKPDQKPATPSMAGSVLGDTKRMEAMGVLVDALCQTAPFHYAMIHLRAEVRKAGGKTSILFTHGTPVLLQDYSTMVTERVGHAAFAVIDPLLREDESFPGFEVVLRKTADKHWNMDFHRLDEPGSQWSQLPHYPFRVCGHGLSLAPAANTIFRWKRTTNPPGILATVREDIDPQSPSKAVQVIFTDGAPNLALGKGVTKAEEVIQATEGPDTKGWTIETPIYRSAWPDGLEFRYPVDKKTRFDLVGADSTFIFVQGPVATEQQLLDTLVEPEEQIVGRGKTLQGHEWIEVSYDAQDKKWRKRHYARKASATMCFLVTAQTLESTAAVTWRASDEVTDSLSNPGY